TVSPVDDGCPVAATDYAVTDEDTPVVTSNVLANDTLTDHAALSTHDLISAAGGAVVYNGDGTFTYSPSADFNGSDSFGYTLIDDDGELVTGTVSITVNPINDSPLALSDSYSVDEDGSLVVDATNGLLNNDSDVDLNALNVDIAPVVAPLHGVLNLAADGSFTYTPDADYNGADTFTYTITDGNGGSASAQVLLTITSINDTPVITSFGGAEQANLHISEGIDVVTTVTASDVDGHQVSFSLTGGADASAFTIDPATGALSFGQPSNFEAPTDQNSDGVYNVEITATDPLGASVSQSLDVTVLDANEAPLALEQMLTLSSNSGFTGQLIATDPDTNDVLSYQVTGGSGVGTFKINSVTGIISLVEGFDIFALGDQMTLEVTITDAGGLTTQATVNIRVEPIEDAHEIIQRDRTPEDIIVDRLQEQKPANEVTETEDESEEEGTPTAQEDEAGVDEINASAPPPVLPEDSHGAIQDLEPLEVEADLRTIGGASLERGFRVILDILFENDQETENFQFQTAYALNTAHSEISIGPAAISAIQTLKEELSEQNRSAIETYQSVVLGTTVASVSISAGIAVWVLRTGALITSLLGSSPMWRQFDPLPVLGSDDSDNDDEWLDEDLDDLMHTSKADSIFDDESFDSEDRPVN
ncbi:MAG: tandem-95 repeat protein, partial [Proteobacteria bacterium]|nr:tandem-95 repeat protein [Pseudomonadota bacterium]